MGLKAGLDMVAKRKIPPMPRIEAWSSSQSLYCLYIYLTRQWIIYKRTLSQICRTIEDGVLWWAFMNIVMDIVVM
jgi:hypothetical protein